ARTEAGKQDDEPPLGEDQNCACVHDEFADAPDAHKVDPSTAPKATRGTQDPATAQEHLETKYDGDFQKTSEDQLNRDMEAAEPRKGKDRSAKDPDPVTAAKRKIALALQGRDNGAEIDSPPRTNSDSGAGAYGPDPGLVTQLRDELAAGNSNTARADELATK